MVEAVAGVVAVAEVGVAAVAARARDCLTRSSTDRSTLVPFKDTARGAWPGSAGRSRFRSIAVESNRAASEARRKIRPGPEAPVVVDRYLALYDQLLRGVDP
jgi:hypothetical protein